MDLELLAAISLPNLQGTKSKRKMTMVEDGYFLLPKVCSTKTLVNSKALFTHIYIEHKGTIGL